MNGRLGARAIAAWWVLSGVCGCSPSASQSAPPANAPTAASSRPGAAQPANVPEVKVSPRSVQLDGSEVGTAPAARLRRIDALFEALKARPPADSPNPSYLLRTEGALDSAQVKSAIQTAAFAGWPAASLDLGQGSVLLQALASPGPQHSVGMLFPPRVSVLIVRRDSVELWRVPSETNDELSKPVPVSPPIMTASHRAKGIERALPGMFDAQCQSKDDCPTGILLLENAAPFDLVQTALRAWLQRATTFGTQTPWLELRIQEPTPSGQPLAIRVGKSNAGARLPPEVIQRVMRAAYEQFQHCYEQGLGRNAQLTGRVVLRFVIALDGHVSQANATEATTMPDQAVVSCIANSLDGLVFPQPEGGIVTVVYPIELSPG